MEKDHVITFRAPNLGFRNWARRVVRENAKQVRQFSPETSHFNDYWTFSQKSLTSSSPATKNLIQFQPLGQPSTKATNRIRVCVNNASRTATRLAKSAIFQLELGISTFLRSLKVRGHGCTLAFWIERYQLDVIISLRLEGVQRYPINAPGEMQNTPISWRHTFPSVTT